MIRISQTPEPKVVRSCDRNRHGLTLLEVLVVTGIVVLLLALIAPAVQAARGRMHHLQCQSNIRQMVLASQLYHDVWDVFPVFDRPYLKMLPYLDQRPLYESLVESMSRIGQPFDVPPLALFRCPVDPAERDQPVINYLICDNSGFQLHPFDGMRRVPVSTGNSAYTTYADFTDGASQTTYYSEKLVGMPFANPMVSVVAGDSWDRRMRVGLYTTAVLNRPDELEAFADACQFDPQYTPPPLGTISNPKWLEGYTGYNHVLSPNNNSCWNGPFPAGPQQGAEFGAITATSWHSGGVNSAFVDGHVRFVNSSIDRRLWRAMASRAGGDHVDQ